MKESLDKLDFDWESSNEESEANTPTTRATRLFRKMVWNPKAAFLPSGVMIQHIIKALIELRSVSTDEMLYKFGL